MPYLICIMLSSFLVIVIQMTVMQLLHVKKNMRKHTSDSLLKKRGTKYKTEQRAPDKRGYNSNIIHFYFSTNTYVVTPIRTVSARRF